MNQVADLTNAGLSKKNAVTITTAINASALLRGKVHECFKTIMDRADDDSHGIANDVKSFKEIPRIYIKKSEIDRARKKYALSITDETFGTRSASNLTKYVELMQDIESENFKKRLYLHESLEKCLQEEMLIINSESSSDEEKLKAARECINKFEPFMTIDEKLVCRRVAILSGKDDYAERWETESIALSTIVFETKKKLENLIDPGAKTVQEEEYVILIV